jgi:carboxyl-terminal processing protease
MSKSQQIARELHGLWRSVGYNRLLHIEADGYRLYTVTAHSARLFERGTASEFVMAFDRITLSARDRLALFHAHDLTRYEFARWTRWQTGCELYDSAFEDPPINLAAFAELFSENYAFFGLRGVNWPDAFENAMHQLQALQTNERLLAVIGDLIAPLRDMHVYLSTPHGRLRSALTSRGPREALQAAFGLAAPQLSLRSSVVRVAEGLRDSLLVDFAASDLQQAGNDVVTWATLQPGVGYLGLLRMFGVAPFSREADDLPHQLHELGPFMEADMKSLDGIFERAMCDLGGHKALIVDARLNGGGFDRAGLRLCERLIDAPRVLYRKAAWTGNGFNPPQGITVKPSSGKHFTGRVFLLISPLTVSAGEVFALAMSALPQVTLMGEATQGILSDNLLHRLPNDWEVSLSNERYETLEGSCFEATGVPPDIELPVLSPLHLIADLRAGLQTAVERAAAC